MPIKTGFATFSKVTVLVTDNAGIPQWKNIGDLLDIIEWESFINGGYRIEATLHDSFFRKLGKIATEFYLKLSRNIPIPIRFKLGWENDADDLSTPEFVAYMTDLSADGENTSGKLSFGALDPATYILSQGTAYGGYWKGNVSSVISQVVQEANRRVLSKAPIDPITGRRGVEVEVTSTDDNKSGVWHQMRMDPQTFIKSLLEFSSSLTSQRSEWIIASGNKFIEGNDGREISVPAIFIKQWPDLFNSVPTGDRSYGSISINTDTPGANDVTYLEFLGDNYIGVMQSQLVTQGISSTSGLYIDRSDIEAVVNDDTTPNKLNADNLDDEMAFTAPNDRNVVNRATSMMAMPELSGGVMGKSYKSWIDGRVRNTFLNMLNALMRIKVTVTGWHRIGDSTKLGVTTVNLGWKDNDGDNYFLGGNWILYGFKHIMTTDEWKTDLYLARIDWDAKAIGVPSGKRSPRNRRP